MRFDEKSESERMQHRFHNYVSFGDHEDDSSEPCAVCLLPEENVIHRTDLLPDVTPFQRIAQAASAMGLVPRAPTPEEVIEDQLHYWAGMKQRAGRISTEEPTVGAVLIYTHKEGGIGLAWRPDSWRYFDNDDDYYAIKSWPEMRRFLIEKTVGDIMIGKGWEKWA